MKWLQARDLIVRPAIDADYVGFPVRHEAPYSKNGRVLPAVQANH
jgi:hypothetical protein